MPLLSIFYYYYFFTCPYLYICNSCNLCMYVYVCVCVYIYIMYVYVCVCMYKYIYLYIYCDESAASPLIISTPRPLIAALHQAPDGSGCVREEGRCNSQVWRRVMRHTPEVNGASSPPLLYAECASPLETGLFPVHARWCPRGSRKGALREQLPHPYTADGPGCRAVSSPEVPWPEGGRSRWRSRRPSRSGPERGARAAAGLRPLPGPFLPEHCPSFTTRAAQRGHQIPLFILDTSSPLDTILLFLFNKSLSEAWRHTHCVCRLLLPPQYIYRYIYRYIYLICIICIFTFYC